VWEQGRGLPRSKILSRHAGGDFARLDPASAWAAAISCVPMNRRRLENWASDQRSPQPPDRWRKRTMDRGKGRQPLIFYQELIGLG